MTKPAKKHHYVPQFYLKNWVDNNDTLIWQRTNKKTGNTTSTRTICFENLLYKDLEESFITPYIDKLLYPAFEKVCSESFYNLDDITKMDFFRFVILLDARNPLSLKSMKPAFNQFKNPLLTLFKEFDIHLSEKHENEILAFILIAMSELNLPDFDKTKDITHREDFTKYHDLIYSAYSKGYLPPPYHQILNKDDVFIMEIISNNDYITSSIPIRRIGDYNKEFAVFLPVSPLKTIIISNNRKILEETKKVSPSDMTHFLNMLHIQKLSNAVPDMLIGNNEQKLTIEVLVKSIPLN